MSDRVRLTSVPEPRYTIGSKVWCARVEWGTDPLPCPDCLGTGRWSVRSPAGAEAEVNCPRCSGSKAVKVETRKGRVDLLTVGSVRIDTAASG